MPLPISSGKSWRREPGAQTAHRNVSLIERHMMNSPAKSGGENGTRAAAGFFRLRSVSASSVLAWRCAHRHQLQSELRGRRRAIAAGRRRSEDLLSDIGFPAYFGVRSPIVETVFEYGPRVGVWRLLRIFKKFDVKISILGVVRAMQQCPAAVKAFLEDGHEIVSHGWRWIDYHNMDEAEEREHVRLAIEGIRKLTGRPPVGWFNGRPSANTRRLLVEAGGFLYDRDALNDELPYWVTVAGKTHLVVPYSLETNDNRFDRNTGFGSADDFARYMIDTFDLMYEEGAAAPKLMSIGLHDRLIGRPGKAVGLIRFLEHVRKHDRVWFCTGRDVAEHWYRLHPPQD
jgi:peptidoglycan/xylan/chitin deacetylase (PgdA/CDA1 family)